MIHLVFSNLKTWLNGIHHGVSAKHLQAYLNEFTFRFNRRFYPFNVRIPTKPACAGRSQRDPAGEGPARVGPSEPPDNECCGCVR
jgi:ISXO2 transposase-like protein